MRYGIVADVHGNLEALQAVLERLARERIDRYLFLGDAVGYGASPNEVCDLLRPLVHVGVLGNHDAAVVGRVRFEEYYDAARLSLEWAQQRLSPENMTWLRRLPYALREAEIGLSHGSPLRPQDFEYVFGPAQLIDLLAHADELAPIVLLGHSHLPLSYRLEDGVVAPIEGAQFACVPGAKHVITVGSVGQPRDRDCRACCGIFDTHVAVFEYVRVEYDIQTARQKIVAAGLPPVFGDRLVLGV